MGDAVSSLTLRTNAQHVAQAPAEAARTADAQALSGAKGEKGFAALGLVGDAAVKSDTRAAARELAALMQVDATTPAQQARMKQAMVRYLDGLEYEFSVQYAPASFKERVHGWSLEKVFAEARAEVQNAESVGIKAFQRVLSKIIQSTKDYHVSISFYSDEKATLPFTVQGVGEGAARKFFIVDVDRTRLSKEVFPFEPGTEIVRMGDRPVGDIVSEVRKQAGDNVAGTDQALAELALTKRAAARGMDVPQGPVTITVRDVDGKEYARQIMWDYTPDSVSTPPELGGLASVSTAKPYELQARDLMGSGAESDILGEKLAASLVNNMMYTAAQEAAGDERVNPYSLGAKKSYLPRLGEPLEEAKPDSPFDWYIYENKDGKLVGYVRIPSYSVDKPEENLKAFAEIVKKMQKETDALVIDQMNNPGGSVFYLYTLASMLSDQPLKTPRHREKITKAEANQAAALVKTGEAIMASKNPDLMAKMLYGPTLGGYPTSAVTAQFMLEYGRFIVSEWEKGHTLTELPEDKNRAGGHIWGVDHINPAPDPEARYTKPILFLTNETCFSGGDFMPSILQDNHRATIMGQRTAGAGGYVRSIESANLFGVKSIHLTGSIAERPIGRELENYGVTPDVPYVETEKDLREGFGDFASAVNDQVAKMIPAEKQAPSAA